MTAIVTRHPLQQLPMSHSNRQSRRLSARLQEKEEVERATLPNGNHHHQSSAKNGGTTNTRTGAKGKGGDNTTIAKKRKLAADYDEEIEGFMFTRAKTRKARVSESSTQPVDLATREISKSTRAGGASNDDADEAPEDARKRTTRKKLSFSTPNASETKPTRRSRRISGEDAQQDDSPRKRKRKGEAGHVTERRPSPELQAQPGHVLNQDLNTEQAATKIALPFADTPVIRRNKAMRDGRGSRGERRSSMGMRGRRASSLIDSGTSNALPHHEVDTGDFYKHIESEGLSEPRRMRQLLTWCATRALGEKSNGKEFEDQSAILAARVIQEELLKDLSDRSEMSDWFAREDVPPPAVPKTVRPNPKNLQNAAKIQELEDQIQKLRAEKQSFDALRKPPELPSIASDSELADVRTFDTSLLSPSDQALHQALLSGPSIGALVSSRLSGILASLGPTVDAFADGVHILGQYRDTAERVATKALSMSAGILEERDRDAETKATGEGDRAPRVGRESLGGVLRGLSRLDS